MGDFELQQVIPWSISAVMMLFAILTYTRNFRKDQTSDKDEIKESLLKVNLKLDQLCSVTTETRTDIKSTNKDLHDMETRLAVVERDLKNAYRMIEEIQEQKGVSK